MGGGYYPVRNEYTGTDYDATENGIVYEHGGLGGLYDGSGQPDVVGWALYVHV
jgi:hypothetical protein